MFGAEPDYDNLQLMATRNFVLFPDVTFPIVLQRPSALEVAKAASESKLPIGVVCQNDPSIEAPRISSDLYPFGVVADVLQVIDLPDDTHTAIVRARGKFKILGPSMQSGSDIKLIARVSPVKESGVRSGDMEFAALANAIRDTMQNILKSLGNVPEEVILNLNSISDDTQLVNIVATHAPLDGSVKSKLLAQNRIKRRAYMLLSELSKNEQLAALNAEIQQRTKVKLDLHQRNAYLQQQLEVISEELYGDRSDADTMRERAKELNFTEKARSIFEKEVSKLERLQPMSPDYSTQYNYLDTIVSLPWGKVTKIDTDINKARQILEADHYGMEKVKERILEQVAVTLWNNSSGSSILCLIGPPGVGKTSIAKSVARSMGRAYERVSLGGVNDESEIRGHRRTYIGALPGRIIQAIKRAGTSNPVIVLDEVDKLTTSHNGDPSSALLEVLDPEQNSHFHDNYIDIDFDLSDVMFIATANSAAEIPKPLLDRMEVIELSGYLLEEKIEIATRHLIPKIIQELSIDDKKLHITIGNDTIGRIIESYTAESGVRQLEKHLKKIFRIGILKHLEDGVDEVKIQPSDLESYLGNPTHRPDKYEGNDIAGVVTGLAWTSVGGEILYIESSLSAAKQFALEVTGNLGTVMKESATIAAQWVKAHAEQLGIDEEMISKHALNIHAPEGAIPKDGPSAGITIVTSIVSTYLKRKVRARTAMTGEITLRGRVLPVGGIKEKILAAKRAGITDIVLSKENQKDIREIPEKYLSGLSFHYVDTIGEVLDLAITNEPAE